MFATVMFSLLADAVLADGQVPYKELGIGGVCAVLLWIIARDRKDHSLALMSVSITNLTMQKMMLVICAAKIGSPDKEDEPVVSARVDSMQQIIEQQTENLRTLIDRK